MNKNKKILIVSGSFYPDVGGPSRILDKLIRDLIKKNFKIKVLTSAPSDKTKYPYKVYCISRKIFKPIRFVLSLFAGMFLAVWADVLYVIDIYSAGQAYWAKKILGKKIIIRFVSDPVWDTARDKNWFVDSFTEFQNKKYSYKGKIENLKKRRDKILKSADKIITVSYFLQNHLQKIGIASEKIKIIYNSVEKLEFIPSKSAQEIKQELGVKGKLLFTNPRLVAWKSVEVLIKCVRELENCNLIILGEGREEQNIKNLISKLKLESRIFFIGKKLGQKFINYLNATDIFVYNTSYEGMSHAILDAMQMSKPIITTDIPANKEIIENQKDGLLVKYDNYQQWLNAIKRFLADENFAQATVENYKKKLNKFNWEQMIEKTIEVLEKIK